MYPELGPHGYGSSNTMMTDEVRPSSVIMVLELPLVEGDERLLFDLYDVRSGREGS